LKVPYSWLKDHVDLRISAQKLIHRLTMAGLEVEDVMDCDGDPVMEINVTPNRGDCLSILGIAREVSALTGQALRQPAPKSRKKPAAYEKTNEYPFDVAIKNITLVPRYMAQIIADVKIEVSPSWMVRRLELMGLRSINNVVDATNYVLLEYGQPLHAFDYHLLKGNFLQARPAKRDEVIRTLDGVDRSLMSHDIVIADHDKAVALGGIMGGENTEITSNTRCIVIESAFFDPVAIRKTSRRLGLSTDSSYRFERCVDINGVATALKRVSLLICELTGGRLIRQPMDIYPKKKKPLAISLSPSQINSFLGTSLSDASIKKSLRSLRFSISETSKHQWNVTVPSYRADVTRDVDLIEEVARFHDYETIPATQPIELTEKMERSERVEIALRDQVRDMLSASGFFEAIHFSFCSKKDLQALSPDFFEKSVSLQNPLAEEYECLRSSLLPSLIRNALYHQNRQLETVRIFELRPVFEKRTKGYGENMKLGGVMYGLRPNFHWESGRQTVDFYDVKGVVEKIGVFLGIQNIQWRGSQTNDYPFLHPGQSCLVGIHNQIIGYLGALHPSCVSAFDLKQEIFVFELSWDLLLQGCRSDKQYREVSKFPFIHRDLALLVDDSISAAQIEGVIKKGGADLIQEVYPFDLYRGPSIPSGKKSLGYSLKFGSRERTLMEEEVNHVYEAIVRDLNNTLQITIR